MKKYNIEAIISFLIGYSLFATYLCFGIALSAKSTKLPLNWFGHILLIVITAFTGSFLARRITKENKKE